MMGKSSAKHGNIFQPRLLKHRSFWEIPPRNFHTVLTTWFFSTEKKHENDWICDVLDPRTKINIFRTNSHETWFIGKINQSAENQPASWHLQATPRRTSAAGERPCRSFGAGFFSFRWEVLKSLCSCPLSETNGTCKLVKAQFTR